MIEEKVREQLIYETVSMGGHMHTAAAESLCDGTRQRYLSKIQENDDILCEWHKLTVDFDHHVPTALLNDAVALNCKRIHHPAWSYISKLRR